MKIDEANGNWISVYLESVDEDWERVGAAVFRDRKWSRGSGRAACADGGAPLPTPATFHTPPLYLTSA